MFCNGCDVTAPWKDLKADLKEYMHVAFNISNICKLMSKIYYNLFDKRFIDYQFNRFAKKATADHLGINFGDIKFLHKMATKNSGSNN